MRGDFLHGDGSFHAIHAEHEYQAVPVDGPRPVCGRERTMNTVIERRDPWGHATHILTVRAPAEEYVGCVHCRGTGREGAALGGWIYQWPCCVCGGLGAFKVGRRTPEPCT
jgi:hypothetical protein